MRVRNPAGVQQGQELSLLPAFRCTAGYAPRGVPGRSSESRLALAPMLSAIDQAAEAGCGAVVFAAGEPTLAGRDLLAAMARAASHGLVVRMVTNAHWAVDEPAADRRIAGYVRAGLAGIELRTGDQHARFVPVERVLHAVRAAVKAGLPVVVRVEAGRERRVTRQTFEAHPALQALRRGVPGAAIEVHESPWLPQPPLAVHGHEIGLGAGAANADGCSADGGNADGGNADGGNADGRNAGLRPGFLGALPAAIVEAAEADVLPA